MLTSIFNYEFNNPSLLTQAFTHRSAGHLNYENLEFLGDAVLELVVSQMLLEKFPRVHEGQLSRMRAFLVSEDSLFLVCEEQGFAKQAIMGPGEKSLRKSVGADMVEAVIGAIWLDSGNALPLITKIIKELLAPRMEQVTPRMSVMKDAKTRLQEFLQGRREPLPKYTVLDVVGEDHEQSFAVKVEALGESKVGIGSSRRRAEQDAAGKLLKVLK